jgi:hypothetical protein
MRLSERRRKPYAVLTSRTPRRLDSEEAMRRILPIALVVLCLPVLVAADWGKAYFVATTPGTWAKHRLTSTVGPPSTTTYTRMPDENGQIVIDQLSEFSDSTTPASTMRYHLEAGFKADRELIDFLTVIKSAAAKFAADGDFTALPDDTVKAIKDSPTYRDTAVFKGTQKVGGKDCDRFAYTRKHVGSVETGELCLNATVPFGLVEQTISSTDASGKAYTAEVTLVDSGTSK